MSERIILNNNELVLNVDSNVNPEVWDETKYYHFLDVLCKSRKYQKEAILTALRFLLSHNYESTSDLAKENYLKNPSLSNKYSTLNSFLDDLHFPDKLGASIDLATGTGKSFVLYGIALIMLMEKAIDQVLILVPSVTIENELTEKFHMLTSDSQLLNAISVFNVTIPQIINGSQSIVNNTICIENRESIYKNSKSSIIDSLSGKGERTLLLNDEVHHVYNLETNEWKRFINDIYGHGINFKYLIGVSGTCYSGSKYNSYFSDVIYRYSLKEAIEDGYIKHIEYLDESNLSNKNNQKWEAVYNSHSEIRRSLSETGFLPLTIFVTSNTRTCDSIAREFKEYLISKENITPKESEDKVLIVHSKPGGLIGKLKLPTVDSAGSKVEWIFSVSMLTEGWDVKRVFQIVPHEERAFNSKLLISQVLGRGVRIPDKWNNSRWGVPKVTIFNHEKWSSNIKELVNEILEIDKILSVPVDRDSSFNFSMFDVDYSVTESTTESEKSSIYQLFEKGYIDLPTLSDEKTLTFSFVDATSGGTRKWQTNVRGVIYSVEDIAKIMYDRFTDLDDEEKTEMYQKMWTIEKIEKIIKISLEKSSNTVINDELKQRFLSSMGVVFRDSNKSVSYTSMPNNYYELSTSNLREATISANSLRSKSTIFVTSETVSFMDESQKKFYDEILDTSNRYSHTIVQNKYLFKTPQVAVIADSNNEKKFIDKIIQSSVVDKWIKSASTGFYGLEYSWRKGEHPRKDNFNPDFFIMVENRILIVEVKGDEQLQRRDPENMGKYKAAINHFELLNRYMSENALDTRYKFTMITPKNFDDFFKLLDKAKLNGRWEIIDNYYSELDIILKTT